MWHLAFGPEGKNNRLKAGLGQIALLMKSGAGGGLLASGLLASWAGLLAAER
jgi:hypothetical protein